MIALLLAAAATPAAMPAAQDMHHGHHAPPVPATPVPAPTVPATPVRPHPAAPAPEPSVTSQPTPSPVTANTSPGAPSADHHAHRGPSTQAARDPQVAPPASPDSSAATTRPAMNHHADHASPPANPPHPPHAPSASGHSPAAAPSPLHPHIPAPADQPTAVSDPQPHHGRHSAPRATMPHVSDDAAVPGDPSCTPEHAAMGHCRPPDDVSRPKVAEGRPRGTALAAGDAPAPAAPPPTYADRIWGTDAMEGARATLRREHGGMSFSQVMLDLAEVQVRDGRDGYRWNGAFWYGGDINRLTVKTQGEGSFRDSAGGEVQALYSRAVGPYFNLQAGVRQDFTSGPDRTYATLGFEGLAPYWFDVEGALFVSDRGEVLARLEGYYDQRITQRLILQPRAELNLSAQDIAAQRKGSGVTDAELGLRLRYEIAREFAPYVGLSWERQLGNTARYARAAGESTGGLSLVAGLRAWF